MRMDKIFEKYAEFYDALYKGKDYRAESNYFSSLIANHRPNRKIMLDLGCGTGRHATEFQKLGYKVVGVDISERMIDIAVYNRPKEGPKFFVGDIREIRLDMSFDVALALFHVMSYQVSNEDLRKTLETVHYHLKDGGLFIFDFWYGPAVLTERPEVRRKEVEENGRRISRIATPTMNINENVVNVEYTVQVYDGRGDLLEETSETHRMRYLFKPEVDLMLFSTGFSPLQFVEFLGTTPPTDKTWSAVMIAEKC